MYTITVESYTGSEPRFTRGLLTKPSSCPHCHTNIEAIPVKGIHTQLGISSKQPDLLLKFQVCFVCPNQECQKLFTGLYIKEGSYYKLVEISIGSLRKSFEIDENVAKISPDFLEIFNQADYAEQMKFNRVTGIAYRKSLEFLIKDFAIFSEITNQEEIKKMTLQSCINKYIKNDRIQKVATAAAWLGNDEAHYLKKWEDKDIDDLKKLIMTCIYYITTEIYALKTLGDMNLLSSDSKLV